MGFAFLLYANARLQGAILGMQTALGALKERGSHRRGERTVASFKERQRLVGKTEFDALERRYAPEAQS